MRKALVIVTGIILVVIGLSFSYAQESRCRKELSTDKQATKMCKQSKRGDGCCMRSMMKSMMSPSLVETKDGGLVVMMGNKLMKFDKDLNLAKETEVKLDVEGMQAIMKQMMENCPCPMHKKMMEKGSGDKGEGSGMKE